MHIRVVDCTYTYHITAIVTAKYSRLIYTTLKKDTSHYSMETTCIYTAFVALSITTTTFLHKKIGRWVVQHPFSTPLMGDVGDDVCGVNGCVGDLPSSGGPLSVSHFPHPHARSVI